MLRQKLVCKIGRRGSFAVEFALVAPVFLLLLFVVFEVAYDTLVQEALDNTLQYAARSFQTGSTQGETNSTFVSDVFCPNDSGLLNCNNVFLRIEEVNLGATGCQDIYDATTGTPPIVGGALQLGLYFSGAGKVGQGNKVGNTNCDTAGSSTGFCNPEANQFVIMSAVYVAPTFLNGLLLNRVTYNGRFVRAPFSTAAFITEPFTSTSTVSQC